MSFRFDICSYAIALRLSIPFKRKQLPLVVFGQRLVSEVRCSGIYWIAQGRLFLDEDASIFYIYRPDERKYSIRK
jgi:hypothetical protein